MTYTYTVEEFSRRLMAHGVPEKAIQEAGGRSGSAPSSMDVGFREDLSLIRMSAGNFRLLSRLLTPIERILKVNEFTTVCEGGRRGCPRQLGDRPGLIRQKRFCLPPSMDLRTSS